MTSLEYNLILIYLHLFLIHLPISFLLMNDIKETIIWGVNQGKKNYSNILPELCLLKA